MKNNRIHRHYVGKTKLEIIDDLGIEFNFFPADEWSYQLNTDSFFFRTVMILYFDNEICYMARYRTSLKLF